MQIKETICMKCQSQFSGKNKKNNSKCCLLNFFPSMLSVKHQYLSNVISDTANSNYCLSLTLILLNTTTPTFFSPLWFEPRSGHMWESQVLLMDGQVVFPRVVQFSPTFDE